jgi:hypothetical protein
MFIILASKPGQYRTEPAPGMKIVDSYDYLFYKKLKATYLIAESGIDVKVNVVEEYDDGIVNVIPAKFLPHFTTLEAARVELRNLANFGTLETDLVKTFTGQY